MSRRIGHIGHIGSGMAGGLALTALLGDALGFVSQSYTLRDRRVAPPPAQHDRHVRAWRSHLWNLEYEARYREAERKRLARDAPIIQAAQARRARRNAKRLSSSRPGASP